MGSKLISEYTTKATLNNSDYILISDQEDSSAYKKLEASTIINSAIDASIGGTLYVDATNNRVGINESSPDFPLVVHNPTGSANIEISTDATNEDADILFIRDKDGTPVYGRIGLDTPLNVLRISPTASLANVTGISIKSTGEVGIGKNAPTVELDVSGTTNSTVIQSSTIRNPDTTAVADTTLAIVDKSGGGLYAIHGNDGAGNNFCDILVIAADGTTPVTISSDTNGSPAARNYDTSANNLTLAMGSATTQTVRATRLGGV